MGAFRDMGMSTTDAKFVVCLPNIPSLDELEEYNRWLVEHEETKGRFATNGYAMVWVSSIPKPCVAKYAFTDERTAFLFKLTFG